MKESPCEKHSIAIEKIKSQQDFYLQGLTELKKSIEKLEAKIDNMINNYVSYKELAIYKEGMNNRVARIEKNLSHATWIVLSTVIIIVLSAVLSNPNLT